MPATDHDIDPELAAALAALPKCDNGSLIDFSDIPAFRARMDAGAALFPDPEIDPAVTVSTLAVPRDDGSVLDVVTFRPAGRLASIPALVSLHAGGQVVGRATDRIAWSAMADQALALDAVIAVVDYRLAPETPAPGGSEDGYTAYRHIVDHADELGVDPARIGITGASGGGAIAAAAALMIRDRGVQTPRFLSLVYPMLDDRLVTPSSHEITDLGVCDRREMEYAWQAVLGDRYGTDDVDAYSAPGRATDLGGLPTTFMAVGQLDVFRDEDIAFAQRLMAAGVAVDLRVWARAFHAWDVMAPGTALARDFERTWRAWVREHLHGV